jgi:hypothetical protein
VKNPYPLLSIGNCPFIKGRKHLPGDKTIIDGFVKSPTSALHCIPCPVKLKAAISNKRYGV